MNFQTKPGMVVNRLGKRYVAGKDGLITSDSEEISKIFKAYGFKDLTIKKIPDESKKKRNKTVWE